MLLIILDIVPSDSNRPKVFIPTTVYSNIILAPCFYQENQHINAGFVRMLHLIGKHSIYNNLYKKIGDNCHLFKVGDSITNTYQIICKCNKNHKF